MRPDKSHEVPFSLFSGILSSHWWGRGNPMTSNGHFSLARSSKVKRNLKFGIYRHRNLQWLSSPLLTVFRLLDEHKNATRAAVGQVVIPNFLGSWPAGWLVIDPRGKVQLKTWTVLFITQKTQPGSRTTSVVIDKLVRCNESLGSIWNNWKNVLLTWNIHVNCRVLRILMFLTFTVLSMLLKSVQFFFEHSSSEPFMTWW